MSARTLAWSELTGPHLSRHLADRQAEKDWAKFRPGPEPTWEEVREAWMAGTGLGALPEGDWRPSPPAPWKHHRKAGDTPDLGAKVTDCSGCPSEREEVPCTAESTTDCRGCNQEVTATGAWEPDGAGGCIRSLTCTDYTAYCSGFQASAADADVVCGCATGAYIATVYVNGACVWYGECSCGGTATATYGQNPNGNASATVTEFADGSCGGAKVDPGWGWDSNPHGEDSAKACCDSRPAPPAEASWIPAALPSGTAVTVRPYTPSGATPSATELVGICGFRTSDIKAVVEYAYGLVVANSDLVLSLACAVAAFGDSMACMCRRLESRRSQLTIAIEPTGACPSEAEYGVGARLHVDGNSYFADSSASGQYLDGFSTSGEIRLYMGLSWAYRYGATTVLRAVQAFNESGVSLSNRNAAMTNLVVLLAHELVHTCGFQHPGPQNDALDSWETGFREALRDRLTYLGPS